MPYKIRCPFCRSVVTLEDAAEGQKTTCPVCKKNLVVTKSSAPPIQPMPPTNVQVKAPEAGIPCAIPVAKAPEAGIPCAIPVAEAVLQAQSVPPSVVLVIGSPSPPTDSRRAGDKDCGRSRRRDKRSSDATAQRTAVVVGAVLFGLVCLLIGVRLLVFVDRWEKNHPKGPGKILPRMEGKWANGADRIDIGDSQGIDDWPYTKFAMVHESKPLSGVLKYQGDSTGIYWMKLIKPKEDGDPRWQFRFDKTVGELKHDPRQDTLTVTVAGKTQVFHRNKE